MLSHPRAIKIILVVFLSKSILMFQRGLIVIPYQKRPGLFCPGTNLNAGSTNLIEESKSRDFTMKIDMWLKNISRAVVLSGLESLNIYCDHSVKKNTAVAVGIFLFFPANRQDNDKEEHDKMIKKIDVDIESLKSDLRLLQQQERSLQEHIRKSPIYIKEMYKNITSITMTSLLTTIEQKRMTNIRRREVAASIKTYGEIHWKTGKAWFTLACHLEEIDQLQEAYLCFEKAVVIYYETLGKDEVTTLCALFRLGKLQLAMGYESCTTTLQKTRSGLIRNLPANHSLVIQVDEALDPDLIERNFCIFVEITTKINTMQSKLTDIKEKLLQLNYQKQQIISLKSKNLVFSEDLDSIYSLAVSSIGNIIDHSKADLLTGYILSIFIVKLAALCKTIDLIINVDSLILRKLMRESLENINMSNDSNNIEYKMCVNMKKAVEYLDGRNKLKVRWVKSHPEKHKPDLRSWNRDDFGIFGADLTASGKTTSSLFFNESLNIGRRKSTGQMIYYSPVVAHMVDILELNDELRDEENIRS